MGGIYHDNDMTALLVDMSTRLARMEMMLQQTQQQEQSEWLSPKEFCQIVGITRDSLVNHMRKGRIHGDAVKNIGTVKRARYVYHRVKAVDQYLNRLPVPNTRMG